MTEQATAPEIQAEQNVTNEVDFGSMTIEERAGELVRQLEAPSQPANDDGQPSNDDAVPANDTEKEAPPPPKEDEFDEKLLALQDKAKAERERLAAKKLGDSERTALRKKEEELASIAYQVLEQQKSAEAALTKVAAFEKMSVQELIYEAMQRSGDAQAVAQAFLDMQSDPSTVARIEAKKRESETVHPLRKELDEIKAQLAHEARARQEAEQRAHVYAEISEAAQLSQQHSEEVPHVARLAAKNQQLFMLRFNQARSILLAENGQAPTGNVLLKMEEDLAPELSEIRETFGWAESAKSSSSSSSAPTGGVKPTIVTNRAASQRTQVADEDDGPRHVDDRARLLELQLRGR